MVFRGRLFIRETLAISLLVSLLLPAQGVISDKDRDKSESTEFHIEKALWQAHKRRLIVMGSGMSGETVTVSNADTTAFLGSDKIDYKEWRVRLRRPEKIPCRIFATQSDGQFAEQKVERAPNDCDDGSGKSNQPPIANANGSYGEITGQNIVFSSVGSNNPAADRACHGISGLGGVLSSVGTGQC